jgi:hypothetical protein
MTQTGGLTVLLAWAIFGALLAILAYLLLRKEKDPLEDAATPTADQLAPPARQLIPPEQPGS